VTSEWWVWGVNKNFLNGYKSTIFTYYVINL